MSIYTDPFHKASNLIPGEYYKVTFPEGNVYYVKAISKSIVDTLSLNGAVHKSNGSIYGAKEIILVSRKEALAFGHETNKKASALLDKTF